MRFRVSMGCLSNILVAHLDEKKYIAVNAAMCRSLAFRVYHPMSQGTQLDHTRVVLDEKPRSW